MRSTAWSTSPAGTRARRWAGWSGPRPGRRERTLGGRATAPGSAATARFASTPTASTATTCPPVPPPDADDGFAGWQAGFRADFGGGADHFTLQGDIFDTDVDSLPGDGDRGHNLLARWTHRFGDGPVAPGPGLLRRLPPPVHPRRATRSRPSTSRPSTMRRLGAHDIVLGGGVRTTRDDFINNLNGFHLEPQSRRLWVVNAFGQDRIALIAAARPRSPGSSSNARRSAASSCCPISASPGIPTSAPCCGARCRGRCGRPSRIDRQLVFLPLLAQATDFESEKLIAFEAGYRGQPGASTDALGLGLLQSLRRHPDHRVHRQPAADPAPATASKGADLRRRGVADPAAVEPLAGEPRGRRAGQAFPAQGRRRRPRQPRLARRRSRLPGRRPLARST